MDKRRRLVLASSSAYRKSLLARIEPEFECASPEVDETPLAGERPVATAERLALAKARALAARFGDALLIGSDQVACLDGAPLGKPGTHARAVAQLERLSGRAAEFHTALCLLDAAAGTHQLRTVPCRVRFRRLDAPTIETYLRREQPYDCAGSAKAEGLGIALIEGIDCEDPTALIGLPLIALTAMLANAGRPVLG